MPYQRMVSQPAQKLWEHTYNDYSDVGHCTLDCPQMAPWDILVGRMAELSKNADGGDMGLAEAGNELANHLLTKVIKTPADAKNPVTAFLGAGMVLPHLLGKTPDNNTWRVFATPAGGKRIFPWAVPEFGHDQLASYIEGILGVATFLRTGRIDSTRAVLHQAPRSPLAELVNAVAPNGMTFLQ